MLTTTSVLRRTAATLSAVGALTALGLVPAAAHDEVLSTSPEQGAVLESAPEQIELSSTAPCSGEVLSTSSWRLRGPVPGRSGRRPRSGWRRYGAEQKWWSAWQRGPFEGQ